MLVGSRKSLLPQSLARLLPLDLQTLNCVVDSNIPAVASMIGLPIILMTLMDAMLNVITIVALLIIGGVETNPGPTKNQKMQLQIITQNVRGINEAKKKNYLSTNAMKSLKKTLAKS